MDRDCREVLAASSDKCLNVKTNHTYCTSANEVVFSSALFDWLFVCLQDYVKILTIWWRMRDRKAGLEKVRQPCRKLSYCRRPLFAQLCRFSGFAIYFIIYLYMKPTHKTVYTMDIKRHNVCCWLIGNCRDEPLTQRRKSYDSAKAKQYKKRTKKTSHDHSKYLN